MVFREPVNSGPERPARSTLGNLSLRSRSLVGIAVVRASVFDVRSHYCLASGQNSSGMLIHLTQVLNLILYISVPGVNVAIGSFGFYIPFSPKSYSLDNQATFIPYGTWVVKGDEPVAKAHQVR